MRPLLAALIAGSVHAQMLRGTVADGVTGAPQSAAEAPVGFHPRGGPAEGTAG